MVHDIIHVLHAGKGNMKIYSPKSIMFPEGNPNPHAINVLLYWMKPRKQIYVKYCWQTYLKSTGTLSQTFKNHIHYNGRLQVMLSECLWRAQYDTLRGTIFTNIHAITFLLNNLIKRKLLRCANLGHGHCNRAAVSRNRYGVEKTVDTHKILINAITFYVCLQEIW